MKQFIVLIAVLPILLLFLVQFTLEQKNSYNISLLQEIVYSAKEEAKQAGCFTPKIKNDLTAKIIKQFKIDKNDILLQLEEVVKYRTSEFDERELIHYKISVPIEKVMAGNKIMGISDAENRGLFIIESWTASERLKE